MTQFVMPSLGADMEDAILVEQLIAVGKPVHRGDIIAAVETQKGVIEVEVFENGFLEKWLVPLGTRVPVGTPIAELRSDDASNLQEEPDMPQRLVSDHQRVQPRISHATPSLASNFPNKVRQRVTPAARRRAVQTGFDLATLGHEEIITLDDLPQVQQAPDTTPLSGMRQAIAAAMSRSKREIPHYYLSNIIDLTAAEAFVADHNADLPPEKRLLVGALFIRAIARAIEKFPEFNGLFENDQFLPNPKPHIGMAINLRGGGLVAPALHDADTGSLDDLMGRLRDLVERVRQGRFRAREMSDPTITLTSLGDRGVTGITGVIFPPQVAIIGIGTPDWQPLVREGQIVARRAATVTLAADHRVSDGHRGAGFLLSIIRNLQKPETL
ncbi:dihydrolipoamide acetyltransferase family protein [uncultured Sulfitobacter sp.]|uniref:dihydrolipoamide acetyltransferase family protein n=1 Tax=uncultured Sulfitobacter sp. TaxID=191468 RepID=UPI002614F316|nr:dihydrolipoamide acetyltransferase family protein [uncultured Sulfitobacter sp.]